MRPLAILVLALGAPAAADSSLGEPPRPTAASRRVLVDDGARTIAVEKRGEKWILLEVRGGARPLELDDLGSEAPKTIEAAITPFLAQAQLLDVKVARSWEHGWSVGHAEVHYLLRSSGAADELACRFGGDSGGGGEWNHSSTHATVRKIGVTPLSFEVSYMTESDSHDRPRPQHQMSSSAARYVLPPTGMCTTPSRR